MDNYGVFWTYYRMFESPSLLLTMLVLTAVCLMPDVLEQVYRNRKDPRVAEKHRGKVRLKLYHLIPLPSSLPPSLIAFSPQTLLFPPQILFLSFLSP